MLTYLGKYRRWLFLLLIGTYTFNSLSVLSHEVVHLVMHSIDILKFDYQPHSHQHNVVDLEMDHKHNVLTQLVNNDSHTDESIQCQEVNDLTENRFILKAKSIDYAIINRSIFEYRYSINSLYLESSLPPPKNSNKYFNI